MAGGNYGGASIPLQSIDGNTLWGGRATTYKDWMCASFVGNTDGTFTLSRNSIDVTIPYVDGIQQTMLISPADLLADPTVAVIFNCYECSCDDPLTGTTPFNTTGYAYPVINTGSSAYNVGSILKTERAYSPFTPTIIGGTGLNN